ncbi:nitrite/sulfite reductase [Tepidimonas taiwanensis]|uniref:Sulfite reductase ferredoxin n=1 Tax=Tepidimonas taiwanensis TaxID=307486 RepID=A0A554XAG8_9BURK|nr:nitrite/sulfite reductase [Tepidimonas taiwanensis]MCX7692878.1 nitrite/sulfite reductase [Tepidimonas taiwanensis]MDM7464500.1 nitrite/sulfite reductase [Tepidimonas taiwanensis]TSE32834.1 Sulfite reductase ferredoxin [Tepidimonas taiwanensis]UBQ05656.1 nitrite/sulfite reductase [Tepidimonas taiwanensis]
MYRYTDFDRHFIRRRAAQFRDQLERHLRGELSADDFKPLRLQNGWYIQRHAPMLRVAIPYGEISSHQLRTLARVAREFDRVTDGPFAGQGGFGHFTTRQNIQFNWIPLARAADVMDVLAEADLHGIQTSGNCIRNITTDALAGIAPDEEVDPRPYCELLRQWSTLHPEFAFLPRKFKIAVTGAADDRAAIAWHDIGLQLRRDTIGAVGFRVLAGGGMGRTPLIAPELRAFVPWQDILLYLEAILRVYNQYGRRDNLYKARIKILVKAEGQRFIDAVEAEYEALRADDALSDALRLSEAALKRIEERFTVPTAWIASAAQPAAGSAAAASDAAYARWCQRQVHAHRLPGMRAVTLSLKRPGQGPGDVSAEQLEAAADLADRFSAGEARITHEQNLLLPWVREADLPALWQAARTVGLATPNHGLLTDLIACPGGDLCALANARTLPVAAQVLQRYQDPEELEAIGELALHISGCMNSCGHHHSGHIGILGVDKDGTEWYQITLGGSDGQSRYGAARPGRVVGPAFAAEEIADAIDAVLTTYLDERADGERFLDTLARIGLDPFRAATDAVRQRTAVAA